MSEKEKAQAKTLIKAINALPPEMRNVAKAYAEGMAAAAALGQAKKQD